MIAALSRLFEPKRLRIVIRQSPDWRNTPYDELIAMSRVFCRSVGAATGFPENFIADIVRVWDATFPRPFFDVRAALKDIAMDNLAHVARSRRATLADSAHARETLIVPIDDDDWLRPDLFDALAPHMSDDADGYVYGNALCDSAVTLRALDGGCHTNSYAVTAKFLAGAPDRLNSVYQHWDANAAFLQPSFRRIDVGLYLSATNKHPASAMKLKDGLGTEAPTSNQLRRLIEAYVDESAQAALPAEAQWVATYRPRVRNVFASLL
jgi:hypothetical protein